MGVPFCNKPICYYTLVVTERYNHFDPICKFILPSNLEDTPAARTDAQLCP